MADEIIEGRGFAVGSLDSRRGRRHPPATYICVGGKDGYVGRDGRVPGDDGPSPLS